MRHWYILFLIVFLFFSGCAQLSSPYSKGEKLFKQEKFEEAKAEFEKAIEQGENVYLAKVYLGRIYAIQGDIKKSIQILKEAKNSSPKSPDAYYFLGIVYQFETRYREAEACLDKVANMPGFGKAFAIAPVQIPYGPDAGQPLSKGKKQFFIEVLKGKAFK